MKSSFFTMRTNPMATVVLLLSALLILASCARAPGVTPAEGDKSAVSAKPAQMTPINLRMHWVASSNHAGFVTALEKGWYKDRNLDVKILDGKGSVSTVQTVGAGQETFGYASPATMAIGRKELPVKAVATIYQKSDVGIMVPKDSAIQSPQELAGKTVIYTAGSFEVPFLPVFWEKNGVDPNSVRLVNIAGDAKYTQYIAGQGDAVAASAPAAIGRSAERRPSRAFVFVDHGVPMAGSGIFTTDKVIQEQPEVVRAFVEATLMGFTWAGENPQEAITILKKHYPDINEDDIGRQTVEFTNFLHTEKTKDKQMGIFLDEEWKPIIDTMVKLQLIPEALPLNNYYTNEFLPKK